MVVDFHQRPKERTSGSDLHLCFIFHTDVWRSVQSLNLLQSDQNLRLAFGQQAPGHFVFKDDLQLLHSWLDADVEQLCVLIQKAMVTPQLAEGQLFDLVKFHLARLVEAIGDNTLQLELKLRKHFDRFCLFLLLGQGRFSLI